MPKTYYDSELTAEQIEDALTAIDGVVTPGNNGKVLYIENGQIKAASASRWSGSAVLDPLSVTANGDYYPPSGTDGFDEVHVAVPSATLTTKSITANGTYNASSDNADGYSSVTVSVPGGATVQPLSVTENGTYTPPTGVDGYAPVTVNVSGGEHCVYTKGLTKPTIDTGVPCTTENLRVVLRLTIPYIGSNTCVFAGAWANNGFLLVMYNGTLRFQSKYVYVDIPVSNVNFGLFSENVVECTKDSITVNGTTYQVAGSQENTSENLKLFSVGSSYAAEIGVYSLDIYVGDELIRSFTPAYNENAACFYDSVSGQYYYNVGSDSLYYS